MATMTTVRVNTSQSLVLYRDFLVQEVHGGSWEWTHEDYGRGTPVTGDCQTMFECIDAVDAWYEQQEAA
jgi:hypothetical protein